MTSNNNNNNNNNQQEEDIPTFNPFDSPNLDGAMLIPRSPRLEPASMGERSTNLVRPTNNLQYQAEPTPLWISYDGAMDHSVSAESSRSNTGLGRSVSPLTSSTETHQPLEHEEEEQEEEQDEYQQTSEADENDQLNSHSDAFRPIQLNEFVTFVPTSLPAAMNTPTAAPTPPMEYTSPLLRPHAADVDTLYKARIFPNHQEHLHTEWSRLGKKSQLDTVLWDLRNRRRAKGYNLDVRRRVMLQCDEEEEREVKRRKLTGDGDYREEQYQHQRGNHGMTKGHRLFNSNSRPRQKEDEEEEEPITITVFPTATSDHNKMDIQFRFSSWTVMKHFVRDNLINVLEESNLPTKHSIVFNDNEYRNEEYLTLSAELRLVDFTNNEDLDYESCDLGFERNSFVQFRNNDGDSTNHTTRGSMGVNRTSMTRLFEQELDPQLYQGWARNVRDSRENETSQMIRQLDDEDDFDRYDEVLLEAIQMDERQLDEENERLYNLQFEISPEPDERSANTRAIHRAIRQNHSHNHHNEYRRNIPSEMMNRQSSNFPETDSESELDTDDETLLHVPNARPRMAGPTNDTRNSRLNTRWRLNVWKRLTAFTRSGRTPGASSSSSSSAAKSMSFQELLEYIHCDGCVSEISNSTLESKGGKLQHIKEGFKVCKLHFDLPANLFVVAKPSSNPSSSSTMLMEPRPSVTSSQLTDLVKKFNAQEITHMIGVIRHGQFDNFHETVFDSLRNLQLITTNREVLKRRYQLRKNIRKCNAWVLKKRFNDLATDTAGDSESGSGSGVLLDDQNPRDERLRLRRLGLIETVQQEQKQDQDQGQIKWENVNSVRVGSLLNFKDINSDLRAMRIFGYQDYPQLL
ncbi:hypothetical protein WICPIJ_002715 [Wickerhamomyces pijperi]|uniref:Uncharacterized protein n=1 Tax=Wickerhamomyces pijperi TaxID=599730 RepID=A0A9P8Q958_WICPI|nr:hypothetical protein WICPIJ_002715 [Wickerhamomyces pijperi]